MTHEKVESQQIAPVQEGACALLGGQYIWTSMDFDKHPTYAVAVPQSAANGRTEQY